MFRSWVQQVASALAVGIVVIALIGFVAEVGWPPVIGYLVAGIGLVPTIRAARLSVLICPEGVTVRNIFRSRRVLLPEVDDFAIVDNLWGRPREIAGVRLRNGRTIRITGMGVPDLGPTAASHRRVAAMNAELQRRLAGERWSGATIHRSWPMRAAVAAGIALLVLFVIGTVAPSEDDELLAALLAVVGIGLVVRSLRLGVVVGPRTVTVRNVLRTTRLSLGDVTGFSLTGLRPFPTSHLAGRLVLVRTSGTRPVTVTGLVVPVLTHRHGPSRRRIDDLNAELDERRAS